MLKTLNSPYAKISSTLIRRINFPCSKGAAKNWHELNAPKVSRKASLNAKARPMLSEWECEEVHQTVALILIARGVAPDAKLTLGENGDWRAVFRAVRALLGIDKKARSHREFVAMESLPDDAMKCEPLPAFVAHPAEIRELFAIHRQRLARKYAYARSQAFAAFIADATRTRKSTYRKTIRTLRRNLRATFREVSEPLFEGNSPDARFVRDHRLSLYLERGESALNAHAETRVESLTLHNFAQLRVPIARECEGACDVVAMREETARIRATREARAMANL